MNAFSRSWKITKLSFAVIGKDKEMLLFPILASFTSILYLLALLFPSGVLAFLDPDNAQPLSFGIAQYLMMFLTYLGLSFISTFCNVCVVYTTKTRFEGGDATFMESIRFGFSKTGVIFQWSLVSATVGLLFVLLDKLAQRLGGIGEVLLNIVRGILGLAWTIVTLFVVPTLVYENVTPKEAIQKSVEVIKKTWGENLISHYGMGLMQFLVILGIIGLSSLLAMVLPMGSGTFFAIGFGVVGVLFMSLVFNVAKTVFQTALYVYANTGQEPELFDAQTLSGAFRPKNAS